MRLTVVHTMALLVAAVRGVFMVSLIIGGAVVRHVVDHQVAFARLRARATVAAIKATAPFVTMIF